MKPHNSDAAARVPSRLSPSPSEADNNGSLRDDPEQGQDIEELNYEPGRPKKTIIVSVCYPIRGRGRPLPYSLDEEDGQ